jgi:hypothetical protein
MLEKLPLLMIENLTGVDINGQLFSMLHGRWPLFPSDIHLKKADSFSLSLASQEL